MVLNKQALSDYIDACELVKETEKDILKLNQKRKTIVQDMVKGSMNEFPYTGRRFKVQGSEFSEKDDDCLRLEERLLEQRKTNAERSKMQVEEWMLTIPARMQRIIRYRYFEEMSWDQVAGKIGRRATADSVRMELNNFLK